MNKICKSCKQNLDISLFNQYRSNKNKYYYQTSCISCCSKINKEKYDNNKKNNPEFKEKRKLYNKKFRSSEHGKKITKEYRKKYWSENKEKEKEYRKNHQQIKKEDYYKTAKIWRNNNINKIKQYNKKCYERRKNDPLISFAERIRSNMKSAFRRSGFKKSNKTFNLLNYTYEDLNEHLKKYLNNPCILCNNCILNLRNCHLDHIKPISLAKNEKDILELNKLINLQLICGTCNVRKSNKYVEPSS